MNWRPAATYPVNDAGRVEVFDTTQHLIEQIGQPLVVQLHLYDLAQVGIHQLHHQISEGAQTVYTYGWEAFRREYTMESSCIYGTSYF